MRKGILYTPFHAEEITRHVADAGFEVLGQATSGNCCDVLARKPS
jgi:hypothetical protein